MKYLKTKHLLLLPILAIGLLFSSCTNLEVEQTDSILGTEFDGLSADESDAQVNDMYNKIRSVIGDQTNTFALSEVTTDALLIPTRGSDWGDNGIWRQLHQHSWTPDHLYITTAFDEWTGLQLSGSRVIDDRSSPSTETKAQAHFIRALAMWMTLDMWGQVPYRDTMAPSIDDPAVFTGADAVNFIVTDLEAAISDLPTSSAGADNVRATKAAGRYLLAKVLLNKHIYIGGAVDNADMTRVISLVDEIDGDGYALQSGYFDIFKEASDTETIWYVNTGVGNRIFNGLHYNSTTVGGGGWNGFSTLAEYYDLFEGDVDNNRYDATGAAIDGQEERRGGVPPSGDTNDTEGSNVGFGFLLGQQYDLDGTALQDRAGSPLAFTREYTSTSTGQSSLVDVSEVAGMRIMKYNPRDGGFVEHEIFFRYSDAHLMKAEAMMRSGGDPTIMVNTLRDLRGASQIAAVSEQDLLDERGRELYMEFWRRSDLVRFGQYTKDWEFKEASAIGNADKNLFPIPASQVILNPNLVQNPGY